MAARKLKVLIAVMAALVLILAAGVAYANNSSHPTSTGTSGDNGTQVVGNDESDGPGAAEEPGDADEPGDIDGPGDVED
jgi:hypothetical protein